MTETYSASTSVEIAAPPDAVWRALTDPELIGRYMHGTTVETEWVEGSPIVWRGEWQGREYEDKGEVLVVDAPFRLAVSHWSPLTGEPDEPECYHHVRYDLEQLGSDRTRLTLTQANSPTQEAADAMVENGWRPMLDVLKQVVEGTSAA
jgi:uncharacterized protein YndB with AHSA1/START domain